LIRFIFSSANWCILCDICGIFRSWDLEKDIGSKDILIKNGFKLKYIEYSITLTYTSILFFPTSVKTGMILKGRLMFSVIRYVINSNSPSGGINVMALSLSNLGSLTHCYNNYLGLHEISHRLWWFPYHFKFGLASWVPFTWATYHSFQTCIQAYQKVDIWPWLIQRHLLWELFLWLTLGHWHSQWHRDKLHSSCGLFLQPSMMWYQLPMMSAISISEHHWGVLIWYHLLK